MAIYTIGDLHLSFSTDKPMDIFGEAWMNHTDKIKADWLAKVSEEDTVIIPGDISWASSLEDGLVDLAWLEELPGKKLLLRGNHDYWWVTLAKMRKLVKSIDFIQNNSYEVEDKIICGARGWLCPNDTSFTESDEKIYTREITRLKLSLDSVGDTKGKEIIVFMHYPPYNDKRHPSGFTELIKSYGIKKVYFGHVHMVFGDSIEGHFDGVDYHLVSCDYVDFKLIEVI